MDFDTAYNILNPDPHENYTIRDIRKKYHILALEFHPDKNKHKNKHKKHHKERIRTNLRAHIRKQIRQTQQKKTT